ncbi:hypothetical protein TrST_g6434 [Triparma strigata]|uniref:Uncharacterized protein n=1 Tax=Triparma strigata TaxID=1606541 RepID=A0A9W7EZ48_9STRA|nr:hypothetical protein TrST_g6434 [Triparma strigata]
MGCRNTKSLDAKPKNLGDVQVTGVSERTSLIKNPSVRGAEEEVMKLMPTTEIKLINLTGFNMSKMKLEEIGRLG